MAITIKIGKAKRTSGCSFPIGTSTATCTTSMKNMTLAQIGKKLGKQMKLTNGDIKLIGVEFTFYKYGE